MTGTSWRLRLKHEMLKIKQENLSSIPSSHREENIPVRKLAHYNLTYGKAEMSRSMGFAWEPLLSHQWTPGWLRDCLKKLKWSANEGDFWSLYAHKPQMYMHLYSQSHTKGKKTKIHENMKWKDCI